MFNLTENHIQIKHTSTDFETGKRLDLTYEVIECFNEKDGTYYRLWESEIMGMMMKTWDTLPECLEYLTNFPMAIRNEYPDAISGWKVSGRLYTDKSRLHWLELSALQPFAAICMVIHAATGGE